MKKNDEAIVISRKLMYSKAGGNAGKNSKTCKVSLPNLVQKTLGASEDDPQIQIVVKGGSVYLEKASKE